MNKNQGSFHTPSLLEDNPKNHCGGSENDFWVCPNCETRNTGLRCKLCNCLKPTKQSENYWKWITIGLSIVLVLLILCGALSLNAFLDKNNGSNAFSEEKLEREESHAHSWVDATCTSPKICSACGETSGNALGHQWIDATYDTPKTCSVCGKQEGTSLTRPSVEVGNVVLFGQYEQDGNWQNGQEKIQWLVLDVQDEYALLLSLYALDSQPYNDSYATVTWENCTIRRWLNSSFLDVAFSQQEQNAILVTEVDNSRSQGNKNWKNDGGNNTKDRVFLLSIAEAEQYFYCVADRITVPTDYAVKLGADTRILDDGVSEAGWWWLRSPGEKSHHAAYVNFEGDIFSNAVGNGYLAVRPALWVDLSA